MRGLRPIVAVCVILSVVPTAWAQAPASAGVALRQPRDATYPSGRVPLEYTLEQEAGRVDVDIFNSKGMAVAGWSGGASGQRPEGSADRFVLPQALASRGTHTVTWDLHAGGYFAVGAAGDPPRFHPGPLVPPGAYVAQVTALGQTSRQTFNVTAEPLLTPERQADLEARFDLAMQVRGRASAASAALKRVRALKARIAEKLARGADSALKEAGAALTERLTDLEGAAGQEASSSSGVWPLHEALAALLREVEAGGRPTAAQAARFQELGAALESRVAELNALTSGSFARFERGEALPAGPSSSVFGAATVLLDRKGIDFDAWATAYVADLKKRWIIPASAGSRKGRAVVTLVVRRSGVVTGIDVTGPSDVPAFNESAMAAVLAARPAPPLPEKYPDETCRVTITFYFNEAPPSATGQKKE